MRVEKGKKELAKKIFEGYSIIIEKIQNNLIIWDYTSVSNNATWKNIYNWKSKNQALQGVNQIIEIVENNEL